MDVPAAAAAADAAVANGGKLQANPSKDDKAAGREGKKLARERAPANDACVSARDALEARVRALALPPNPLDQVTATTHFQAP